MRKDRILLGAAALLISACAKAPVQDTFRPLVLTASLEGEGVKTTLDATDHQTVRWSEGDAVAVFSDVTKYTSSSMEIQDGTDSQSAKFTFSTLDAGASVSYAVYPAGAAESAGTSTVTVTVPTVQTAVAGGFAPGAAVAVSKPSESAVFKNVCGFLAFTINADGVKDVRIYANESMTGTAELNWNSGNLTDYNFKTFAYRGVELTGTFTKGTTYYAAVFPNTYTGVTFKITHSDGYVSTYTSSNNLVVARKSNQVISPSSGFALRTPASGEWFEKDPAYIGSSEPVILVGKVDGVYRLVANNGEAGSAPGAAQQATVSGSTVTNVDDAYKWNLKPTSAGSGVYTLYPNGTTARWLYCETTSDSGSQNCMTVGTNSTRSLFTWDAAGYIHTKDSYKDRYLSYNDNKWCGETFPNSSTYPAAAFSFYVQVPNP